MKKKRKKFFYLERAENGDTWLLDQRKKTKVVFTDSADLAQLGIYLPRRGQTHAVAITCELLKG